MKNNIILGLVLLLIIMGMILGWGYREYDGLKNKPTPIEVVMPADTADIVSTARIGWVKYDYKKFLKEFGSIYKDTNWTRLSDTNWVDYLRDIPGDSTDTEFIELPMSTEDSYLTFSGKDTITDVEYELGIHLYETFIPPPLDITRRAVIDSFIIDIPEPDTILVRVNPDLVWKVGGISFILGMITLAIVS